MKPVGRILLALLTTLPAFVAVSVSADSGDEKSVVRDCADCPPLREIAPGHFMMGTALGAYEEPEPTGESPQVSITVAQTFLIGVSEVNVEQFSRFVGATGYRPNARCREWVDGRWTIGTDADWQRDSSGKIRAARQPVGCVSWHDAKAYTIWLSRISGRSYRLPSEVEWEYAARGGSEAPRWWGWNSFEGVSISDACRNANVYDVSSARAINFPWPHARCSDGYVAVAPVQSFLPNPYGLFDMIGNAWELTADAYLPHHRHAAAEPALPDQAPAGLRQGAPRVIKGGSFLCAPNYCARYRSGSRQPQDDDLGASHLGFRTVLNAAGPAPGPAKP